MTAQASPSSFLCDDVHEWFDRRTLDGRTWWARELAAVKGGTTISVVLPARNEAATVGTIVACLRRELVDTVALIDELVVIDSGSVDDTAAVAAAAGATVFSQQSLLPALGDVPGKGEALWKSLIATEGQIVAFIDSDLQGFEPQFVVGLLGPLLTDPTVDFVKAFYDRPLRTGEAVLPAGGGRVTELVARPLLNAFWPALAGFIQPLAGEYGGRRSLLEQIPFLSGYGVEIGMLIDVLDAVGLDAMAQVDLGQRRHRNSTDVVLGRMAMQIQLAAVARLRAGAALGEPRSWLTQFTRDGDDFVPCSRDLALIQRPPMTELADYRDRWKAGRSWA